MTIPFPNEVRNITDFKPSRGDATFDFKHKVVEWKVPTKDGFSVAGTATLTGTIMGSTTSIDDDVADDDLDASEVGKANTMAGYYDDDTLQHHTVDSHATPSLNNHKKIEQTRRQLMPRSIAVSFAVRGWLPSGIKVDGLNVDAKKSRGLGEGVKPYKGVKYMTVSRKGVERRL